MAKDSIGSELTGRFEHVHGSQGIDFEIENRNLGCFVMGWLGCTVDHEIGLRFGHQVKDSIAIADIDFMMREATHFGLQSLEVLTRAPSASEEDLTHVVVDTDAIGTCLIPMTNGGRADQAT